MKSNEEIRIEHRVLIEQMTVDGGRGWIPGLDPQKPNAQARVQWSNGLGWDHVSVSWPKRCPTWDEMARVKKLFFHPKETCVEYHPAESEYVNYAPTCLHIWRYQRPGMPVPPPWMVGPMRGQSAKDIHRQYIEAAELQRGNANQHQTTEGLKCYLRMGELDKEFTCRMELCPYWSEDDTGTSKCNVPGIIKDAIAILETIRKRPDGEWLRVPDYPGDEDNPAWDCSECGAMCSKKHNFCPCCGAQMKIDDEEGSEENAGR